MWSCHLPFPLRNTFKASSTKHGPCTIRDEDCTLGNTKGRKVSSQKTAIRRRNYRRADKYLARPGRKQARKRVRDARDFNNIETRAVVKFFFFLQGKAPKEIHAILTETLACFLPGRGKELSAPLYLKHFTSSIAEKMFLHDALWSPALLRMGYY